MALFNHATKEVTLKVVYYGPTLSGKTANLRFMHDALSFRAKGKLVSLTTDGDRTLFFEFVPFEPGAVPGTSTRVQLYTVPGVVRHEATWRMVLKGCDAVVFVADSQASMLEANAESLRALRENLLISEVDPAIPQVIQYNKRDLATALPVPLLEQRLNSRGLPFYEAVAAEGTGVEETLRGVTRLLLEWLARRPGASTSGPGLPQVGATAASASEAPRAGRQDPARPAGGRLNDLGLGAEQWFYLFEGEQCGPCTLDELVDLLLTAIPEDTKVWRPGMEDWVDANRVGVIADEIPPPVPNSVATSGVDDDMPDFDTVPRMLRTVLIADEDAAFRRFLAMPLAALGFTIYEAADGETAWRLAVQNRPWVMLADISMPELDGFEFCRRVRGHPLLSRKPVIFISGSDKYKERYRALQIGADDFLSKSMPIRELLMRMQLLMERYSELGASLGERPGEAPAAGLLQGRIEVFGAPALVQICNQGRLSGVLSAATADGDGTALLGFRDGEIVSALVDAVSGVEAVYLFLSWQRGSFRFTPGEPGPGGPLAQSVEQLLLEGWRRLDAARRSAAGLP